MIRESSKLQKKLKWIKHIDGSTYFSNDTFWLEVKSKLISDQNISDFAFKLTTHEMMASIDFLYVESKTFNI